MTDDEWNGKSEEWRDGYNSYNNGNVMKVRFDMMPEDWQEGARYAAQHPCGDAYTAVTGRMLEKGRKVDRMECAIRHIQISRDVDQWAKDICIQAIRYMEGDVVCVIGEDSE